MSAPTGPAKEVLAASGRRFRYFEGDVIGNGGFATVYGGADSTEQPIAVKVLDLSSSKSSSKTARAVFRREIEIGLRIAGDPNESPHLLPLLDIADIDEHSIALVLPRAGTSLNQQLRETGPFNETASRDLLADLLAGLEELAHFGIAHRDITSRNVLRWRGQWVLADFGISRVLADSTSTSTWAGAGTQVYWAPELWDGSASTVQSDLYAAGCVVAESLTGVPPFGGPNLGDLHRSEQIALPAFSDPAFDRTIRAMLSKNPGARPVDAREARTLLMPQGHLSASQHALQRVSALGAARRERDKVAQAKADAKAQLADQARARYDAIWDAFARQVADAMPYVEASIQGDTRMLRAEDFRIQTNLVRPRLATTVLLIGAIAIGHLDAPGGRVQPIANVVAAPTGDGFEWTLETYSANAASADRPSFPARDDNRGWGVNVDYADQLLSKTRRTPGDTGLHIPPVFVHSQTLTADALVDLFAAEAANLDRQVSGG